MNDELSDLLSFTSLSQSPSHAPMTDPIVSESPTPPQDRNKPHKQHHKSDRYRHLEERIEELQEQMATTQEMIRNLTDIIQKQHQAANARQNLRLLTAKAVGVQASQGPLGPTTAILKPFIPSLTDNVPPPETEFLDNAPDPPPPVIESRVQFKIDSNGVKSFDTTSSDPSSQPPRKMSTGDLSPARRRSASNPITLTTNQAKKNSMAQALAHAASFVNQLAKGATFRRLFPDNNGPNITRRFSMSSLDLNGAQLNRPSWIERWSRTLFKRRVEPLVSPQEIRDARSEDTKVHPFSIRHDTVQRLIWDIFIVTIVLVDVVFTPLSLSFKYDPEGLDSFNILGSIVFFLDFLVNMFSSYTTERGVLVSGPSQTIRHYFLSPLALPDLLSWFPFEFVVSKAHGRFVSIVKIIRLAKVSQLAHRVHSSKKAGLIRMLSLFGSVFIVSHLLSCYWNWVAKEWRDNEEGYMEKPLIEKYAHCWSLVIGSLNASPPAMFTSIEEVSVAVFMLIGNVLQATVFGSFAVLISSFDENEVEYNKKLISTYERCKFLDIPDKLARRIQGYYENLYRETRSVSPDADAFINELSPALICEVKFQLYRDMIKQIPFLSATHINPVVIEMLILHLRTVIYMQDDVLIRKGEFGDWMGFIGTKGSVGVLDPQSNQRKIIRILRKGDYFGEMALLQRAKRSTTAVALSWVQIHVLCRNDLDDVKEQYPEQAEILEEEINKYMKSKVTYK
ncbi:hypothetical protein Poli38472_008844 [Pythium oligandrum]|uniref:Cyclic nucleotide-binding domain-containing protein n=1 Tax=Pythium oligandrum TaxID=41045 RepID=A0A8K1C465_PYTOL|nr:hypothetical protein Poli38472_008844 [Pythium oligandrum]|eukprot:TMW56196.1 hypothetical protein Poli38472_008844 [Pythium oligandrum]